MKHTICEAVSISCKNEEQNVGFLQNDKLCGA